MVMFSDEVLVPLFRAIGTIVICWSYVEQPMDMCVAIIYQHCNGKPKARKQEIPRAMTVKIEFLQKCFKQLDCLVSFKDEGLSIINRAYKLSTERNDIIHMRLCGINPDGSYLFDKFDYTRNIHEVRKLSFTINDFLQFGNKMMGLASEIVIFCQRLQQFFVPIKIVK